MGYNTVRLPRPEEHEMIKDAAKKVFAFVGVELKTFKTMPNNGLAIKARLSETKRQTVISGLFDYGILLANVGNNEWGFAIRV